MLYDSWEEWTNHEQWAHHQRVWRCSEHPQDEYVELVAYEDHIRTYHQSSKHHLLSAELLKSRQSVSQVSDRPCPFCQRDFEQAIDLQQHVAGHLESVALLSLPNLYDIDENSAGGKANSNSANRNYAESKADDFDHSEPLAFHENDQLESNSVATEIDKEVFKTTLKAESIVFESTNESNAEARQAYSNELVGGWLTHLPRGIEDDGRINPSDSEEQAEIDAKELIAVDEPVEDLARPVSFENLGPADEQIRPSLLGAVPGRQGKVSSNYWLPEMFNQSLLSTPLEKTDEPSVALGEHSPGTMTSLDEAFVSLIELPFDDGDLIVRLCYRREDGRSRFVCRTIRPAHSRNDCSIRLVSLDVSRSGPFLEFYRIDQPKKASELWARLKFSDYESTYIILLPFRLFL